MAAIRPHSSRQPPGPLGPRRSDLTALLGARQFRLGAGTDGVAQNLRRFGGEVKMDAPAFVGTGLPPAELPSVALGEHVGTLGPFSFGFLNNVSGIAALASLTKTLPRRGGVALVVPERAALPDLVPTAITRDLGISYIVSVGRGDPTAAIEFMMADPHTACVGVVLSDAAEGERLKSVLGGKPTVILGGDALCQAVARRAGAFVARDFSQWLARLSLLQAGVISGAPVRVVVCGGGIDYVRNEMKSAGLQAQVSALEPTHDDLTEAIHAQAMAAHAANEALLLIAGTDDDDIEALLKQVTPQEGPHVLWSDLKRPEQFTALIAQLAERAPTTTASTRVRIDRELLDRVRSEIETTVSDHDCKRLFKSYGVRVTKQGPAATPTAALKVALQIGLPVQVRGGATARLATTPADVKRFATLIFAENREGPPAVMVQELFPETPRAQVRVTYEKSVGLTLVARSACALLPLSRDDAELVASELGARRNADVKTLAEFVSKIAAACVGEDLVAELELYTGPEPAVLSASGAVRRK